MRGHLQALPCRGVSGSNMALLGLGPGLLWLVSQVTNISEPLAVEEDCLCSCQERELKDLRISLYVATSSRYLAR
eukprot:3287385-Amphidinium_carterae.2